VSVVVLLLVVILLLLLGGWIIGATLWLLGVVLTGLIVGALARLVLPGTQGLGIAATILYGIGGSLLGAILGGIFDLGGLVEFILAVALAALLIALIAEGSGRRTRA
jgi:uncharacterized membrane protein YeaQ/YmgE (transglycosylase-associated protein family)